MAAVERTTGDNGEDTAPDSLNAAWLHWADGVARKLDPTCDTDLSIPLGEGIRAGTYRCRGRGRPVPSVVAAMVTGYGEYACPMR